MFFARAIRYAYMRITPFCHCRVIRVIRVILRLCASACYYAPVYAIRRAARQDVARYAGHSAAPTSLISVGYVEFYELFANADSYVYAIAAMARHVCQRRHDAAGLFGF